MTSTDRAVHVPRMADVVAGDLRRRIASGELAEGMALPREAELVAQYGVSRPTLREAIRILESESLIAVTRGSRTGALVQPPDVRVAALHAAIRLQLDGTTLADVVEARIEIGVAAVRMLAARSGAAAVLRLRSLHERERTVAHDSVDYPVAVSEFHAAIVDLAGNRSLALLRHILEEIVLAHERATPNAERRWTAAVTDHDQQGHDAVIGLIERGDTEGAGALWRAHLVGSAAHVLGGLGPSTVVSVLGPDGLGPGRNR